MPTYVLSHEAVSDIKGITDYIAQQNVTAAIKLLGRIEETCQMLAENPGLGEVRQGFGIPGCRSFTVSRYVVFFRPSNNGIAVARILDASRDL
jgi:toxin ParE1/3/4